MDYSLAKPVLGASGRWELPDPEVDRMVCLFDTEAAAEAFKVNALARMASRATMRLRVAELEAEEKRKHAAYLASFGGFLSPNPLVAGRQRKALDKVVSYRGYPMPWRVLVARKVSEGCLVTENGLEDASGAFVKLGAIATQFASHLISLNQPTAK